MLHQLIASFANPEPNQQENYKRLHLLSMSRCSCTTRIGPNISISTGYRCKLNKLLAANRIQMGKKCNICSSEVVMKRKTLE
jgi:hypothetical protein